MLLCSQAQGLPLTSGMVFGVGAWKGESPGSPKY